MSTEKNDENEAEKETFDFTKMYKSVLERSEVPNIEIPFAVQDVISRIEQAQLQRAREVGSKWKVLDCNFLFNLSMSSYFFFFFQTLTLFS